VSAQIQSPAPQGAPGFLSSADEIAFDREYVRQFGIYGLLKLCWPVLCPLETFQDGPHIKEVCDHVGAVVFDAISRLLVNVPPGSSKSLIVSVLLPAYVWGPCDRPVAKFMFATYATNLATRDANRCRDLIRSKWFQDRWPVELDGVAQSTYYTTKAGGWRYSEGIGAGTFTGRHPDFLIVDDSVNAQDTKGSAAELKTKLLEVQQTWDQVLSSRGANPSNKKQILIGQRLHDEDIFGYLLARAKQQGGVQYQHLRLPMLYEADEPCVTFKDDGTPFGGDWRTIEGQLLCEARWSEKAIEQLKFEQGNAWSAQYQQRPASKAGQIFRRAWFRFWIADDLMRENANPYTGDGFDEVICSWDLTFKDTLGSDFVCGQVWARLGPNYYLLDRVYRRLSFPNTLTAIEAQLRRWSCIGAKLIEDKANGPAVISVLVRKVSGLIPVEPQGSKIARANAVSYLHRAGNVYYPPEYSGAVGEDSHVEQLAKFPLAKHDDSVDAETQALLYFTENRNALYDAIAAQSRAG
jgi:predicted phage terminase large subunit-like protein